MENRPPVPLECYRSTRSRDRLRAPGPARARVELTDRQVEHRRRMLAHLGARPYMMRV